MSAPLKLALRILLSGTFGLAIIALILGAGVLSTMSSAYDVTSPRSMPDSAFAGSTNPTIITVAVALGSNGSVVTDVLGPYDVFARSPRFQVYTVSRERQPVALSGALTVVPDFALADVQNGSAPAPSVIVVPAFTDPYSAEQQPIRDWIASEARGGTTVLGVCAGAEVLVAAGVLSGKTATTHWANLDGLRGSHPETTWVAGRRYVQDENITTTAGVTSGIIGALHLVGQLSGAGEAQRIGRAIAYPDWRADEGTRIAEEHAELNDYPYLLNAAFPWFRPTYAVGLTDGVDEIDVAAAFEVYSGTSFATSTVAIAERPVVMTAHRLMIVVAPLDTSDAHFDRLVIPGEASTAAASALRSWADHRGVPSFSPGADKIADGFAFDPVLSDLARAMGDGATARTTAKYAEYPAPDLSSLPGAPWRPIGLLAVVLLIGGGVAMFPVLSTSTGNDPAGH
jgi:transcriptional regulator GlxA family with amidase domain